jgi:hypothetical protein
MIQHLKSWWAAHVTWITMVVAYITPSVNAFIAGHPKSAVTIAGIWALILHLLPSPADVVPPVTLGRVGPAILAFLLLGSASFGQTPPPDVPITHVNISASFTGYDSKGKMEPANVDVFGVPIYRNTGATRGFDVDYKHVAVPSLGQRWELGQGCFWLSLPKVKNLLIDTSNFISTSCAGAGKLLSAKDGNRLAYTLSQSIAYPIAGHMSWTISYDYLRATGGIAGVVNKSFQSVGTGPSIHF